MRIINDLKQFPKLKGIVALTLGNFDGVHLGHQALLEWLRSYGGQHVVFSFSNHPSEILKPEQPSQRICTLEHKLILLEKAGVDLAILLPFTQAFSQQTAEEFIQNIRTYCPFTHLILGHDAVIGKNRSGDRAHLQELAKRYHFALDYLDEKTFEGSIISSSKIRAFIRAGLLEKASALLGRPYSIYVSIQTGQGLGKRIGFPTLNLHVENLCLPPLGVYVVDLNYLGHIYRGVANLGFAPTVRENQKPILEVHLIDPHPEIEGGFVEVLLRNYLRPEQKFASIDALKKQIAHDVEVARGLKH